MRGKEAGITDRNVRVVELGEDRGDEVAALMARAFYDDPLMVYACPDPAERARWLPWLFRWSVWKGYLFGRTLGTEGRLDGVAATIGPDGGEFTEEHLARFGYGRGREAMGAGVWDRVTGALRIVFGPADEALHSAVPGPHWYLDVIAVDPDRQGLGVGGSLIRAVNARADTDGLPVVLFTCQPRNLPLYQHHGYEIIREGMEPASGVRWWGFRREPAL